MEEIKKSKHPKPKNKNEESSRSQSSSSESESEESVSKKKKSKQKKPQLKKQSTLIAEEIDELLPESMVIDNKITSDNKKKPPRDYSPEDEVVEETPSQAIVLEEEHQGKVQKDSKALTNLQEAIQKDEKELKKIRKKEQLEQKLERSNPKSKTGVEKAEESQPNDPNVEKIGRPPSSMKITRKPTLQNLNPTGGSTLRNPTAFKGPAPIIQSNIKFSNLTIGAPGISKTQSALEIPMAINQKKLPLTAQKTKMPVQPVVPNKFSATHGDWNFNKEDKSDESQDEALSARQTLQTKQKPQPVNSNKLPLSNFETSNLAQNKQDFFDEKDSAAPAKKVKKTKTKKTLEPLKPDEEKKPAGTKKAKKSTRMKTKDDGQSTNL